MRIPDVEAALEDALKTLGNQHREVSQIERTSIRLLADSCIAVAVAISYARGSRPLRLMEIEALAAIAHACFSAVGDKEQL